MSTNKAFGWNTNQIKESCTLRRLQENHTFCVIIVYLKPSTNKGIRYNQNRITKELQKKKKLINQN